MIQPKHTRKIILITWYVALAGLALSVVLLVRDLINFAPDEQIIRRIIYVFLSIVMLYLINKKQKQIAGTGFKTWRSFN